MTRSLTACLASLGLLLLVAPARAQGEPVAPDVRPEALKDFRQSHPFKTLDNPKMVAPADAAFLRDEDDVLAVTVLGQSRAYPTRFMGWHHGVNDRVGDVPFAVTYCNVSNTAIGYDLRLDGKTLAPEFHGLYNAVVALRDRETGTTVMSPENGFSQNYRLPPPRNRRPSNGTLQHPVAEDQGERDVVAVRRGGGTVRVHGGSGVGRAGAALLRYPFQPDPAVRPGEW